MFDLLLLEKQNSINKNEVGVASSINQFDDLLKNKDIKLILISAHKSHFLIDKNISLFVNISSFQEMNLETINKYFDNVNSLLPFMLGTAVSTSISTAKPANYCPEGAIV